MMKRAYIPGIGVLLSVLIIVVLVLIMRPVPGTRSTPDTIPRLIPENRESRIGRPMPVEFVSESIRIDITDDRVTVTGSYTLRSSDSAPVAFPLMYPFPIGSGLSYPDTVTVVMAEDRLPIPFRENRERGMIMFSVKPGISDTFVVTYTQKIDGTSARYILTSTKAWGKPLERAVFTVIVPSYFRDVELSYKPDNIRKGRDTVTYTLTRTDFMPDRDLVITWNDVERRL